MAKKKSSELTLTQIVAIDPAVGELIRSARRRTGECDLCRMGLGRRKSERPGFKQQIAELVGWKADSSDDRLATMEAYQIVYRAVWNALPVVQRCARCGWVADDMRETPQTNRGSIAHLRALVWDNSAGRCYHCGGALHPISDFEVDHLHPRAQGGGNEITNLVASCRSCNRSKGAKRLEEWRP